MKKTLSIILIGPDKNLNIGDSVIREGICNLTCNLFREYIPNYTYYDFDNMQPFLYQRCDLMIICGVDSDKLIP